ncbi:hypothetical protein [Gemmatimonas sp.]|uniref:DUF7662 domain-containing protein n=1 Tax=Gemmatimonas sp. TaxID=1962908 RepID=UPI0035697D18
MAAGVSLTGGIQNGCRQTPLLPVGADLVVGARREPRDQSRGLCEGSAARSLRCVAWESHELSRQLLEDRHATLAGFVELAEFLQGLDVEIRGGLMAKYDPLRDYLVARAEALVKLSFSEVEGIIGAALPASARQYQAWWANEASGNHVEARAWLDAGYRTAKLDLNAQVVEFHRV